MLRYYAVSGISGLVAAASSSSDDSSSRYVFYGTVFTGLVTLMLGVIATFATRRKASEPESEQKPKPGPGIPSEVIDLRKQRDALQKKNDELEEIVSELVDLCWKNQINPNQIPSKQHPGTQVPSTQVRND